MNSLADHDVYAATIQFLAALGHEVVSVAQLGLQEAEDCELLHVAHEQARIMLSRDRDFGGLVFAQGQAPGIVYLRILPSTQNAVHAELKRVLTLYTQQELQGWFVVVEPGRHRIRRAPNPG